MWRENSSQNCGSHYILGTHPQKTQNEKFMQIMCNGDDSLMIRFGFLERDYSLFSFNLTGLLHDSLFC